MIRGWLQLSPSDTMIAAAPEGTPPRRIGVQNSKQLPAPPCLVEALRRESIVCRRFSWSGCELPFMSVSNENRSIQLWSRDGTFFIIQVQWMPRPRKDALTADWRLKIKKNFLAPLCLGEALMRESIVFWRFLWLRCECYRFMFVSTDPENFPIKNLRMYNKKR
jgi:hypothetical protein